MSIYSPLIYTFRFLLDCLKITFFHSPPSHQDLLDSNSTKFKSKYSPSIATDEAIKLVHRTTANSFRTSKVFETFKNTKSKSATALKLEQPKQKQRRLHKHRQPERQPKVFKPSAGKLTFSAWEKSSEKPTKLDTFNRIMGLRQSRRGWYKHSNWIVDSLTSAQTIKCMVLMFFFDLVLWGICYILDSTTMWLYFLGFILTCAFVSFPFTYYPPLQWPWLMAMIQVINQDVVEQEEMALKAD